MERPAASAGMAQPGPEPARPGLERALLGLEPVRPEPAREQERLGLALLARALAERALGRAEPGAAAAASYSTVTDLARLRG